MTSYNRSAVTPSPPQRQPRVQNSPSHRQRQLKFSNEFRCGMSSHASDIPCSSSKDQAKFGKVEENNLSGCIAELKRMAAAHKKIGEIYSKPREPINKNRKSRRGVYNDASEVNDIINNLKKYRKGPKRDIVEKLYFKEPENRRATPKNNSRPSSTAKTRPKGPKMRPANYSFIDPNQILPKKNNQIDTNLFFENKRYRSAARGQENNLPVCDPFCAPLYASQAYGDPFDRMPFHSKNNSKANIEPESKTTTAQLSQLKKAYNIKDQLGKLANSSCTDSNAQQNLNLSNRNVYQRPRCSKSCTRGNGEKRADPSLILTQEPPKHPSKGVGQRRLVTALNECTYGKETTKSSDKTSMMHTKGSIKTGKNEMSYTQCCPDYDSISLHSMTVLNQINHLLGKQENQSVEDIHFYFVAFYQRTKNMLKKVEENGRNILERTGTDQRDSDEKSIISVEESEDQDDYSQT